jgi:hypothetical protein
VVSPVIAAVVDTSAAVAFPVASDSVVITPRLAMAISVASVLMTTIPIALRAVDSVTLSQTLTAFLAANGTGKRSADKPRQVCASRRCRQRRTRLVFSSNSVG